jgi:hypothetical protein
MCKQISQIPSASFKLDLDFSGKYHHRKPSTRYESVDHKLYDSLLFENNSISHSEPMLPKNETIAAYMVSNHPIPDVI